MISVRHSLSLLTSVFLLANLDKQLLMPKALINRLFLELSTGLSTEIKQNKARTGNIMVLLGAWRPPTRFFWWLDVSAAGLL